MIRAGISGTNWTGKTTTIRQFCAANPDRRVEVVALSDYVVRCPFPMEENQTLEASRWMLEQIQQRLEQPGSSQFELFDRTPLDILGFTAYAFDRADRPVDTLLMTAIADLLKHFAAIFYAPPADPWPSGVSPVPQKIGFALLMDWYMRREIRRLNLQVTCLPWHFSEREKIMHDYLYYM